MGCLSDFVAGERVGHWELSGIRRATVNWVATCLKMPVRLRLGLAAEVHCPLFWEAVASE